MVRKFQHCEAKCVNNMNKLLVDFNDNEAADIIRSILDKCELNENLVEMATEIGSFYDEYTVLLQSKATRDIDRLRGAIREIEMQRIIEKLRIKYKGWGLP